jgi:opacity protein-like surface antigen
MKRIVTGVVAVLLLLTMSGAVRAEGEGTEVTAGVKTWMNNWKREAASVGSETSNYAMLIGPAIEVEFSNHVFVEGSYMMSASNYKFSSGDFIDREFKRNDLDLAVGYMLTHHIGLFAGYRDSRFEEKDVDVKESVTGPLAGIRASAPLDEAFSIYGKLTYLLTTFKSSEEGMGSEKAPGWVAEVGAKYAFNKQFAGSLGYKFERTETKESEIKDTFSGVTLDVMYTF